MSRGNKRGHRTSLTREKQASSTARSARKYGTRPDTTAGHLLDELPAGFTLADEARHTGQRQSSDPYGLDLRRQPVVFISAGANEPLKQLDESLQADSQMHTSQISRHVRPASQNDVAELGPGSLAKESTNTSDEQVTMLAASPDGEITFFFDKQRQGVRGTAPPIDLPERSTPDESSSDDEVILFQGRGSAKGHPRKSSHTMALTQMQTEIRVMEEQMCHNEDQLTLQSTPYSSQGDRHHKTGDKDDDGNDGDETSYDIGGGEDAIIADYIANLKESGEMGFWTQQEDRNRRDLGGGPDTTSRKRRKGSGLLSTNQQSGAHVPIQVRPSLVSDMSDATPVDALDDYSDGTDDSESPSDLPYSQHERATIDELDVMDWQRPSLNRRRGKGRRMEVNFGVSDSELEMKLQTEWKTDRLKKAERKKQREQLRALGQLGKKKSKEDLRVKYPTGMSLDQVVEELKSFLLSNEEVVTLPPMDKHARKIVHEFANKLKLKSKSTGKSEQRRPILYRTGRTLPYTETAFENNVNRVRRQYFPRLDIKGKRKQTVQSKMGSNMAASYREGEIIGAAAPELGSGNRGRAMLEKMGWSSGTALGAFDNKGILQPVAQTMKKGKAGLG